MHGLPTSSVLLALVSATILTCSEPATEGYEKLPREPHDLIVVLVDTLRADRLGAYGHDRQASPRIDELADRAILFARCIAQSTWTLPSVASLLTGLLPSEYGVHRFNSTLDEDLTMLAELLQENGYATAGFVSNPLVSGPRQGMGQGFDVFETPTPEDDRVAYARAEVVVDDTIAWLENTDERPFFLYAHLIDPHAPYDPPEPFRSRFDRG